MIWDNSDPEECQHDAWTEDDDCTLHCDHCGYCKPFDQDVDPDTVTWLPEQPNPQDDYGDQ